MTGTAGPRAVRQGSGSPMEGRESGLCGTRIGRRSHSLACVESPVCCCCDHAAFAGRLPPYALPRAAPTSPVPALAPGEGGYIFVTSWFKVNCVEENESAPTPPPASNSKKQQQKTHTYLGQ